MADDTLARRLARFAMALRYEDLPPAVVDKAKACIQHCIGVGLAGHGSGAVQVAKAAILAEEAASGMGAAGRASNGATILVTGEQATPYGAAFVNSSLMHAKLQEDAYHTGSHPGVVIVPAALAVAETRGKSGRDLITAVAAGYEIQAAMTADFIPRSNEQGFRSSPTYGPFGAAIAAGHLLGLTEEQATHAIGYAATFAAGTFEGGDGTNIMVLQVSQAARSGLLAACLAEQNARASDTSLEGPIGFYYAFTGGTEGIQTLADHLGSRWEIMDVTLKRYPTSMFNQPPIHVILALTEQHDLQPDQISSILVEMNDFETTYPSPKFAGSGYSRRRGTGATGFVVAAACVNRGFSIPPDRPAGWASPVEGIDRLPTHAASLELWERVTVVGSSEIPPLAPRVTVTMKDGATHTMQATGDELKLSLAQDRAVVRALIPEIPGGARQAERLIAAVEHLEDAPSVTELIAAAS
ncbi:MAG: MmgE/PrpD family protein [Chloroflexota bacterium]